MAEDQPPAVYSRSPSTDGGRAVKECETMIQRSLRTPMAILLKEHLEKAGCALGDNLIKAVNCAEKVSGGYMRGRGIYVCSNHMELQDDVNQVVINGLIKAYDECRAANLDWTNCAHHACSEIRAGHLSGDCHYKRELLLGYMKKVCGHEQECVRRRAMKSVTTNPHCLEAAAKDAIEAVWDVCYKIKSHSAELPDLWLLALIDANQVELPFPEPFSEHRIQSKIGMRIESLVAAEK